MSEKGLPEGFEEVGGPGVWWRCEEGATVQGVLLETVARQRKGKDSDYMRIKLTKPTKAVKEKQSIDATIGMVVNVDVKASLQELADLGGHDVEYEVYIHAIEKKPTEDGTGTYWTFKKGSRRTGQKKAPF